MKKILHGIEALFAAIKKITCGRMLAGRHIQLAAGEDPSDRLAYDGWLKVYKRKIKNREYDVLKDYNAVSAIIVNEFNELLLVKQYRPALMRETLEIPAGVMDNKGESEHESLVRELKEETGLQITPESLVHALDYKPMVGFSNSLMKVFYGKASKVELKAGLINDEDVYEALWMGLDEVSGKISRGEIQDVKTILAYYYLTGAGKEGHKV